MKPQPQQLAIWDNLRRPGRKTEKPYGCPTSIWETIQKSIRRGKPGWTEHDILRLVRKHAEEPIGKVRKRKQLPDPPPQVVITAVETIAYPRDICSPITQRMIQEGKLPGIYWDPKRGGIRTAKERRML